MIIKFINGNNSDPSDLKSILAYVSDKAKTTSELSGGYCCDSKYPYEDMLVTKQLHRKTAGKQYEHYVVSFDPDDGIDAATAFNVVSDITHHYNCNQAFWAVHTNTPHIHAHIVMNSVSYKGNKFRQWKPQLEVFKSYINSICRKYGISTIFKVCGKPPVDDINLLEFTNDEYLTYYGGVQMTAETNDALYYAYSTDDWSSYSEQYDDYDCNDDDYYYPADDPKPVKKNPFAVCPKPNNYSPDNSINPPCECVSLEKNLKHKNVFFGDSINIATTSPEKALEVIHSCPKNPGISVAGLKSLMNELGDDVDYHLGNEFNIFLIDDDNDDDSDYIDTSFTDIE